MAVTAATIIQDALLDLKVIGESQTVSTARQDRALRKLNNLIASWSSDFIVPNLVIEELPFGTSKQSYTIGSSGTDLVTARPEWVHSAQYKTGQNQYYPLTVFADERQYGDIVTKNVGGIPRALYYNPTYPNGIIYLDRVADASASLALSSFKPLTSFASTSSTWDGPEEYLRMMEYGLATELSTLYVVDESTLQRVAGLYNDARRVVERKVAALRVPELRVDGELNQYGRPYNVLTDY